MELRRDPQASKTAALTFEEARDAFEPANADEHAPNSADGTDARCAAFSFDVREGETTVATGGVRAGKMGTVSQPADADGRSLTRERTEGHSWLAGGQRHP